MAFQRLIRNRRWNRGDRVSAEALQNLQHQVDELTKLVNKRNVGPVFKGRGSSKRPTSFDGLMFIAVENAAPVNPNNLVLQTGPGASMLIQGDNGLISALVDSTGPSPNEQFRYPLTMCLPYLSIGMQVSAVQRQIKRWDNNEWDTFWVCTTHVNVAQECEP